MTPHRFIDLQGFGKAAVSSETLVVDTHTTIGAIIQNNHDYNFSHYENLKFNAKSQLQNAFPFCKCHTGNIISASLHS
jgi:hypothetical protein